MGADKDEGLTMQRGSVILRELKKQGHYDNDDVTLQSYEVGGYWIEHTSYLTNVGVPSSIVIGRGILDRVY